MHVLCPLNNYQLEDWLKTKTLSSTEKLINYMNELIGMGVAGFRIDAAKHMWPADLKLILDRLHYLPTEIGVPPRTKPFIFQQVIDLGSMYIKHSFLQYCEQ